MNRTEATHNRQEHNANEILEFFHKGDCKATLMGHNDTSEEPSKNRVNS